MNAAGLSLMKMQAGRSIRFGREPKETTTMNFHQLLLQRDALLRQARIANLAFAYDRLADFARRLARARIVGELTLPLADPAGDRPWPVLPAMEGSQSVIEEHFTEEAILELAGIFAYFREGSGTMEFTFRPADLEKRFLAGARRDLEASGVSLDAAGPASSPEVEDSNRECG